MTNTPTTTGLSGVPRTMLMTTRARVEEHQRADGIFRDPKIADWWPALSWDSALDIMYSPLGQLTWAVRAHLIDDMVRRHLSTYADAVVVELGAGLSTRYYRVGQSCRHWLELDLPAVTTLRRQLDTETAQHRFVSASALEFDWMTQVPETLPEAMLIIAEGLLMYFEQPQVQALVNELKGRFPGATLVCDAVGGLTHVKGAKQLKQLGAPLKWLITNEGDIAALGLSVVEVRSLLQENYRYPDRIGFYRWVPWLSQLPPLRNAGLVVESRLMA